MDVAAPRDDELSARQQQVLASVLDLMVEEGDAFSMAAVAQRANCSKETLYKWFGDRDGLLTATVQWQAAKVRMPQLDRERPTREALRASLEEFARNWLTVITGDVSIALNRLAIAHAATQKSGLGGIVLHNGPNAMARRLQPIFELGRLAGLLRFDCIETAFTLFFGLVVADVQIRALLGDPAKPDSTTITRRAEQAVEHFFALCGAPDTGPKH